MATLPVLDPIEDRSTEQETAPLQHKPETPEPETAAFQRLERVRERLASRRRHRLIFTTKLVVAVVAIGVLILGVLRQASLGRWSPFRTPASVGTLTPSSTPSASGPSGTPTPSESVIAPPPPVLATGGRSEVVPPPPVAASSGPELATPLPVAPSYEPEVATPTAALERPTNREGLASSPAVASPRRPETAKRDETPRQRVQANAQRQRPAQPDRQGGGAAPSAAAPSYPAALSHAAPPSLGDQQNDRAVPTAAIDWLLKTSRSEARSASDALVPGKEELSR